MTRSAIVTLSGFVAITALAGVVTADPVPVAPPPRPVSVERVTAPGRAFAAKGRIDLFVAATALWQLDAEDDHLWEPALELAWVLAQKSEFTMWPPESSRKAFSSIPAFCEAFHPKFIRRDERYRRELEPMGKPYALHQGGIMAPGVSSAKSGFDSNIIVSRGDVRSVRRLGNSIVYANGDVVVGDLLSNSVVVCDGNVIVEAGAGGALVVARGSIHIKGLVWGCTLAAGKTITIGNKVIRPQQFIVLQEKEPHAFGFVNFFELKTIGVEVEIADRTVRVSNLVTTKPFAKSGVQVGDIITSVNDKKPESAESLRRLLRDALAIGNATVVLRRGDRTESVKVSLPE